MTTDVRRSLNSDPRSVLHGFRNRWPSPASWSGTRLRAFRIAELSTRPVGRPSQKPVVWYKSFLYQTESWRTARRVVAKVEFHFGELFPRVGFIVLRVLAYNLGNPWRRLVLPRRIDNGSLTSLPQRLVKTGGRWVKHAVLHTVLRTVLLPSFARFEETDKCLISRLE